LKAVGWTGRRLSIALAMASALVATIAVAQGGGSRRTAGYAWDDPQWRFTHHDRPVKVVLLAGSIGAYRDRPYGALLHQWCANAEIRNISRVGYGAPQLLSHFTESVLHNPNVPIGAPNHEMWLLYGGGLNSIGSYTRTNYATNRLFALAHRRGFSVVGMTLTPWGEQGGDDARWQGGSALTALSHTRRAVDFVLGRLGPRAALGQFADRRQGVSAEAPWTAAERPDVTVDLYDSRLRNRAAEPWPLEEVRDRIRAFPRWRLMHHDLTEAQRAEQLEVDARFLAEAPRWFLRREYRGFDHIHPNRAGHRVIAETACPRLPESWGCQCP